MHYQNVNVCQNDTDTNLERHVWFKCLGGNYFNRCMFVNVTSYYPLVTYMGLIAIRHAGIRGIV